MTIINDPIKILFKAIDYLYPTLDCEIQFNHKLESDDQAYGATIFPSDKSEKPFIEINPKLSIEDSIEIIAHEIAHVVAGQKAGHDEKWEREFQNINERFYIELEQQYRNYTGESK